MSFVFKRGLVVFAWITLGWVASCLGQSAARTPDSDTAQQEGAAMIATGDQPSQPSPGTVSGTVVDQSGAVIAGARVTLTRDPATRLEALSGTDGQFSFSNVDPGPFQLTITSKGFAEKTSSGVLHSGEIEMVPQIVMGVAENITEVDVGVPRVEVAEEQIKVEEKQRVLGAVPNFYVSYDPHAVSLSSRQKFELAVKSVIDPFTLAVVAGTAGVQQAQNHFADYGQGMQGYAKRFGAGYADTITGTFIGGAILPSLLKQDPRYFYKGTGSTGSRAMYAISMAVICKGDNGRWQFNYSGLLGSLAAGGISNLYYPAQDRDGLGLTIDNTAIGIGETALTNLLQEFLIKKLTPKSKRNPPTPPTN